MVIQWRSGSGFHPSRDERNRRTTVITLSLKDGGTALGTIDEADLQVLMDQLVEETEVDVDYYVDLATVDLLAEHGASAELVSLLTQAIGDSDGVEIVWTED
jgi:hypothetical protein